MSTNPEKSSTDLSELIAENFGANATYVESLLARFRSDPALVDESWRAYFEELIGENGARPATSAVVAPTTGESDGAAAAPAKDLKAEVQSTASAVKPVAELEAVPIRGPALKIVENMEASLAVP